MDGERCEERRDRFEYSADLLDRFLDLFDRSDRSFKRLEPLEEPFEMR